jgi:hypothetical protein
MTTATGSAEESPFSAAMDRQPEIADPQKPVARDYTFSIARGLVNIHGMVHSVADVVSALAGKMRTLADRGPEDYEKPVEDMAERVAQILAKKYAPRHVTYNNGDGGPSHGNGEKRLLKWILGIVGSLFVLAIVGGITLYGEFTALRATVTTGMNAHEQRLNRVEQRLDRSSANAP